METRDMVRMANQMAAYFNSFGAEEGSKELAAHISNFWAPPIRREFFKYVAEGGKDFEPMVMDAAALVRPA